MANKLFDNAVASIRLGIEDYRSNDLRRTVSAVRNFYAGVLLLAKGGLLQQAPGVEDPFVLLAANYKPVPNGNGGVEYVAVGQATIDHVTIKSRFRDFNLEIDAQPLAELNKIRNDMEHYFSSHPRELVLQAIARVFPLVVRLFELNGAEPAKALGEEWTTMLEAREFFERLHNESSRTFAPIKWAMPILAEVEWQCPSCGSQLLAQVDPDNDSQEDMKCRCRACGETSDPVDVVQAGLEKHFEIDNFLAAKDGGDPPVQTCPDCGLTTYVMAADEHGCAWCGGKTRGACNLCGEELTPNTVSWEDSDVCAHCHHVMTRDN